METSTTPVAGSSSIPGERPPTPLRSPVFLSAMEALKKLQGGDKQHFPSAFGKLKKDVSEGAIVKMSDDELSLLEESFRTTQTALSSLGQSGEPLEFTKMMVEIEILLRQIESPIKMADRVSLPAPKDSARTTSTALEALEVDDDVSGGAALSSSKKPPPLGKKDKALGFTRTRTVRDIQEPWLVNGKKVATQTIRILETRERALGSIQRTLQELEGRTGSEASFRKAILRNMLRPLEREQAFLHSDGVRDVISSGVSVEEIAFAEPSNMVRDSVTSADGKTKFSLLRLGALSDHLNSAVSLQLLQQAIGSPPSQEARKQINDIRRNLEQRLASEKLAKQQQAVLQHMINQLLPENLKKTCLERREILRQQALLLITAQVEAAAKSGELGDQLHLAYTSLLYPGQDKWEKCGIAHVEQRMIEDMQQIFSEMNGEKISLDQGLRNAYVDADGHIHLPQPEGVDQESLQLATHYTNISVAHTLTSTMVQEQEERTREVIDALRTEFEKREKEPLSPEQSSDLRRAKWLVSAVEKKLKKNTTFEAAADLIEAEKLMGWAVSTGCYSNKDRGGMVGRALLTRFFTRSMEAVGGFGEKTARTFEEDNPYAAYAPGSCQLRFAQDVVSRRQRYLKAVPSISGVWKIIKVCVPIIVRAGLSRLSRPSREDVRRPAGIRLRT